MIYVIDNSGCSVLVILVSPFCMQLAISWSSNYFMDLYQKMPFKTRIVMGWPIDTLDWDVYSQTAGVYTFLLLECIIIIWFPHYICWH